MSTEPSRTSGRVRDWLRLTSACFSHSHPGATTDKAPKRWLVPILPLGLLLGLTTVARGQSFAPGWPALLASRDGFPPEVVSTVERVWSEPTLHRTVHGRPARVPFAIYVAFVDSPDVTAAAARFRELASYEVEPLDEDRYLADDHDGARGVYRVLVRESHRRVMVSWGQHSGHILGTIRGSALTDLELIPRGETVEQTLTAYVRIDNRLAAALARLLIPLFGYLADRKLAEGIGVSAPVAGGAVEGPGGVCPGPRGEPPPPRRPPRTPRASPTWRWASGRRGAQP